ncbi:MAG: polysaccharide deacetylase family protein [Actinomycetota bacterium]
MRYKRALALAAHRGGLFSAAGALFGGRRLTVLAYHRVADRHGPEFDTYRRNVSASPEDFSRQMDHVAERFHPVSLEQVEAALDDGPPLPRRPLLVTFDDGYRDNLLAALPVLQDRGIPMAIFLATDFVDGSRRFPWDLAAWCFHHTARDGAELPVTGWRAWAGPPERERVLGAWLETLKRRPEEEREEAMAALPEALGVVVPPDALSGLCLSWDEVRAMASAGVSVGAHTAGHPILTRVSADRARSEVAGSKRRVEEELGRPVTAFAYPNGGRDDLDDATVRLLAQAGYRLGFTLFPGPERAAAARQTPLTLRRVYVHHGDHPARFAANVNGVPRLLRGAR